jgi:ABC-type transporter Mla maintaining outer membrane lipid asymmetry permease subunit MlaE
MKMNQEIDAMQVMGVDPFEALVFPGSQRCSSPSRC